jgi:hypothetical protein
MLLSRRDLLLGAGGLLVARPALVHAQSTCAPPGNPGTPTNWTGDYRAIHDRLPAHALTAAYRDKLRTAYKKLRDLHASDPADPRGWMHQANIHCFNCGNNGSPGGAQIHGTLVFFAWHRAELYFHERILGWHLGDDTFRLPYWNWEIPASRTVPPPYATPAAASNALFDGTRSRDGDDVIDAWRVDDHDAILLEDDFTDFSAAAEGGPHGSVHVWTGGDMGAFATAGRDPVFFAHHGNVDKMWSDWQHGGNADLADAAYRSQRFTFYDEDRKWVSISVADVLDHESKLRYRYGAGLRRIDPGKWKLVRRWPLIVDPRTIRIPKEIAATRTPAVMRNTRLALKIVRASVPGNLVGTFRVVASVPQGGAAGRPLTLGAVSFVPDSADHPAHGAPARRTFTASLDITPATRSLVTDRALELKLVPDEKGRLVTSRAVPVELSRVEVVEKRLG